MMTNELVKLEALIEGLELIMNEEEMKEKVSLNEAQEEKTRETFYQIKTKFNVAISMSTELRTVNADNIGGVVIEILTNIKNATKVAQAKMKELEFFSISPIGITKIERKLAIIEMVAIEAIKKAKENNA